jgi:hypothetical protein
MWLAGLGLRSANPSMRSILLAAVFVTGMLTPLSASATEVVIGRVAILVHVAARTSLTVSTDQLRFDPLPDGGAEADIDFCAAARIASSSDIVLTVQPLTPLDGEVTFSGSGDGTGTGTLSTLAAATAGRWHGSGLHRGRLVFRLRDAAQAPASVPVRFVLSAP